LEDPFIQIKTVLIDEHLEVRRELQNALVSYPEFKIIGELESTAGMNLFSKKDLVDCIFLNTSRLGPIGMANLEEAINFAQNRTVVLSSNPLHAVASYEMGVFDFLLIPYTVSRLELAANRIIESLIKKRNPSGIVPRSHAESRSQATRISIKNGGKIQFVDASNILFVEASGYYIEINLADRKHLVRQSLGQFLEKLDPLTFVRIHRSTIVNVLQIEEIIRGSNNDYSIRTKTGKILRISKSYRARLFLMLKL